MITTTKDAHARLGASIVLRNIEEQRRAILKLYPGIESENAAIPTNDNGHQPPTATPAKRRKMGHKQRSAAISATWTPERRASFARKMKRRFALARANGTPMFGRKLPKRKK